MQKCVEENVHSALDQADYQRRYSVLLNRYEDLMGKRTKNDDQRQERSAKRENIAQFLKTLEKSDTLLQEFDEGLWYATVDEVTVFSSMILPLLSKTERNCLGKSETE